MAGPREQDEPVDAEAQNARMAMKLIRQEIKRVLDHWDPQCLKGLPGFANEYNDVVGPISVMVRKRVPSTEIALHLEELVLVRWKLQPDRRKCLEIAEKIRRTGAFLDG